MSRNKLPDWFHIEKYSAAHDFGAMGWYEQLVFRERLFASYDDCVREGDKNFRRLSAAFGILQDDPIITWMRIEQTKIITSKDKHGGCSYIIPDPLIGTPIGPWRGSGITPLTTGNRENIEPKNYGEEGTLGKLTFYPDGTHDFYEPPLRWYGRPIVALDLTIKDGILLQEMRDLLREMRKTYKPPQMPFVKNSDFLKWYNSGVLPYLDLLLWEKTGHNFKWAAFIKELSQILDKPVSSESAAIKAAQTYAKRLMDKQTLRTLEAQAARERPRNAKKSGKFLVT